MRYKVLLVTSNDMDQAVFGGMLSRTTAEVISVPTIKQALKTLLVNKFDCLLVDYRLVDGWGTSLIKQIRERDREIVVLVLTDDDECVLAREAMKLQINGSFAKETVASRSFMNFVRDAIENKAKVEG